MCQSTKAEPSPSITSRLPGPSLRSYTLASATLLVAIGIGLAGCASPEDAALSGSPPVNGASLALGVAPAPSARGRQQLSRHRTPAMAAAPIVGRVDRSVRLTVTVGLPVRDRDGLARAVELVSDPMSPTYRQYLTPEAFADQYGADPADYQKVLDWAQARGLQVEANPNRLIAHVTGTAPEIEAAFHVQLHQGLRPDGSRFFGPDREPSLDLDVPVDHVSGLDDYVLPRRASSGGSGAGGLIFGRDFRNAHASCTSLTGAGQSVGILSLGAGFQASDISTYASRAGFTGVPPISTIGPAGTGTDLEDTLDAEMATAMAPGAQVVMFRGTVNQILGNMAAHPEIKQLSSSWFTGLDGTSRNLISQFAMQGQSFFEASGDSGALNDNSIAGVNDFRTQPAVTVVGGTDLAMVSPGLSYSSEVTWPGSTGGILSNVVNNTGVGTAAPSYQWGIATPANQASATYRNVPDVSMVANGVEVIMSGSTFSVGGTSAATPLWAGFMALINQRAASQNVGSMGFVNPALYLVAKTGYATNFNDVTAGSNPTTLPGPYVVYNATPGYDLTTGLGTPKCSLITTLSALSNLSSAPSVSARGAGVLEIFARQGSNVIHRTYGNGNTWGPWQLMPNVSATSAPASVSWASNRIDVFVKGAGNELRHAWWNQGSDWAGWEDLGCCFDTAPAVASWGANHLDVFMGSGGALWHKSYSSGWSAWENIGGHPTSAPAAVSWGSGRIDVFTKGAGNELTHTWYNSSTGWSGWWENLGCCFDTAPGVSSWGPGRLDVFQGGGGTVWHQWYNDGWGWAGWENLGGAVTSDLSATSWGQGRIDIMARGASNHLTHMWYNNPSGWGFWETL